MPHDFTNLENVPTDLNVIYQSRDINKADLGKIIAEVSSGSWPVIISSIRNDGGYDLRDGHGGRKLHAYGIAVVLSVEDFVKLAGVKSSEVSG